MKTTKITTIRLEADKGKILTDGKVYGSIIFLGSDRTVDEFYEIGLSEYEKLTKAEDDNA